MRRTLEHARDTFELDPISNVRFEATDKQVAAANERRRLLQCAMVPLIVGGSSAYHRAVACKEFGAREYARAFSIELYGYSLSPRVAERSAFDVDELRELLVTPLVGRIARARAHAFALPTLNTL